MQDGGAIINNRKWNAKWIWESKDRVVNKWVCFRKNFEVEELMQTSEAFIAVDSKYWLWINDRLVVFEGGLNRGPKPGWGYYDCVDLKDYLKVGINTITVLVWYWGNEGRNSVDSGQGAFLFELDLGGDRIISDSSWRTNIHPAYIDTESPYPANLYSGYNIGFDGRLDIQGWTREDFNDKAWKNSIELGTPPVLPWGRLLKRPIPLIKDYRIKEYINTNIKKLNECTVIEGVLPYAAHVTPYFKINAECEGLKIDIRTDRYTTNGGPGDNNHQYNGHRTEYITRKGIQEFESLDWLFGEQVIYTLSEGIKVLELGYRESGYDTEFAGNFSTSDEFLNRLYEKCRRTLYVCLRDNYMDCPDRERGQWIGDVSSQVPQTFYALDRKVDKLTRKAINDFILWRDGAILRGNVPGKHCAELPSQSLNAISEFGMIMSYYISSGDESVIHECFDAVKNYLQLWSINSKGLVEPREGSWQWYDHGDFIDGAVLENAWYFAALKAACRMSEITGNISDTKWLIERIESIRDNFDKAFWKVDGYRSGDFCDDRANAIVVLSGLADKKKWKSMLKIMMEVRNSTPYMEGYVLEAMCKMGYKDHAVKRMKERYEDLVNNSNSTLWEDFHVLGTKNHAWSGGPLTVLCRHIAGIDTATPGYDKFHVLPHLGDLKYLNISVPSVKGNIEMKIEKTKDLYKMNLTAPEGAKALVGIPKKAFESNDSDIVTIMINNTVMWEKGKCLNNNSFVSCSGEDDEFIKFCLESGSYEFLGK
jgi:alpha-L-rhamnosidase